MSTPPKPGSVFEESWFYAPDLIVPDLASTDLSEAPLPSPVALPADEAHHAFAVLRLREGDAIMVTDGRGSVYAATLAGSRAHATVSPVEYLHRDALKPRASLALALLKGRDCEDPVAAACELALSDIYLLRTDHAQVFSGQDHEKLANRLRQKSIVALKQAKKTHLTQVHAPTDLMTLRQRNPDLVLAIAHPGEDSLPEAAPARFALLVGPEGGFSDREMLWLSQQPQSYRIGLGTTRLRAVHAPLVGLGKLLGLGWLG